MCNFPSHPTHVQQISPKIPLLTVFQKLNTFGQILNKVTVQSIAIEMAATMTSFKREGRREEAEPKAKN